MLVLVLAAALAHATPALSRAAEWWAGAKASGDTVAVFGPRRFEATGTRAAYYVERFAVNASSGTRYLLRIQSGQPDGSGRPTHGTVLLNGAAIVSAEEIARGGTYLRPVDIQGRNTVEATVQGAAGAAVTVTVLQVPDGTFPVLTPRKFVRGTGAPVVERVRFATSPRAGAPFVLHVVNGNADGTDRVSSAVVTVNGDELIGPADLNPNVAALDREARLGRDNELAVEVRSAPGSFLTIWVTATDTAAPELEVLAPRAGLVTKERTIEASGRVHDETATEVAVNGVVAARSGDGFTAAVPLAQEGTNTLVFHARDAAGNTTDSVRSVIRDTEAPKITLGSPAEGAVSRDSVLHVAGTIQDRSAVTANVNGVPLTLGPDGSFRADVPVVEGTNFLTVTATDAAGNASSLARQVMRDTEPPALTVTAPTEGLVTNQASVAVSGTAKDASAVTVRVNGVSMAVDAAGAFSGIVPLPADGHATLHVEAVDAAGNTASADRHVIRDTQPPALAITAPAERAVTNRAQVELAGTVADSTAVTVTVGGASAPVGPDGRFTHSVALPADGETSVEVLATDAAGNQSRAARVVIRDTEPPVITITAPAEGLVTRDASVHVTGRITDRTAVTATLGGRPLALATDGSFSADVPLAADGTVSLAVAATDAAGNPAHAERSVTRDTEPPRVTLLTPAEGAVTRDSAVAVSGTVQDRTATTVTVNGQAMGVDASGRFQGTAPLPTEGANAITAAATDAAGNQGTAGRTVTRDTQAPHVTLTSPAAGALTNALHMAVSGRVEDAGTVRVTVNGAAVQVAADGTFTADVPLTAEGENAVTAEATDAAGNTGSASVAVIRDTQAPQVTVTEPVSGAVTNHQTVVVSGTVRDATTVTVTVNGVPLTVDAAGAFGGEVPLSAEGTNALTVTARDAAGNESAPLVQVTRDTQAPVITISAPAEGTTTRETHVPLTGTVADAGAVTLTVNGSPVPVAADGTFSTDVALVEGSNAFSLVATDAAGNTGAASRTVTRAVEQPLPPDPATVAPPLDRTVPTTTYTATKFIYQGTDPVQTGVVADSINPVRAGLVRGRVITRDGSPLPGATVRMPGHPELGQTTTRADGRYDLVVNGGGALTVAFGKPGYLPAQRGASLAWGETRTLADVVLLQPDSVATPVTFGADTIQVARGSTTDDGDGVRTATILINPLTTATLRLPDGSTEPLAGGAVRLTEYTVGEHGPGAMPAELPPASRYTYAFIPTVDGTPPGAIVELSQPATVYVDNFLNFPVGSAVPTGGYDPAGSRWIPEENGRVVRVVGGGIDATGSGRPSPDSVLQKLGITPAEVQVIERTYTPGQTLWRTRVAPLVWPHDLNWPGALLGSDPHALALPACREPFAGTLDPCTARASSDAIRVTGTPFALHYTSARAGGDAESRTLELELTDSEPDPNLQRVELEISVAGRSFTQTFEAARNLTYTFTWDGKDAFGRTLQGAQPVLVRVGHVYPLVWQLPAEEAKSFGLPCYGAAINGFQACTFPDSVTTYRMWAGLSKGRREGVRWQEIRTSLGTVDPAPEGMGGYSLTPHDTYDPVSRTLYRGDGGQYSASDIRSVSLAQGIAATGRLAAGSDGSVYTAAGRQILRRMPDGRRVVVAGTGAPRGCWWPGMLCGDGQLATEAEIAGVDALALAPGGTLYFAAGNRVYQIAADDRIHWIAGNGTFGDAGEGQLARESGFRGIKAMAFAPDGALYLSDDARVYRIGTDDRVVTAAGGGTNGVWSANDGRAATSVGLSPGPIAFGPDGSLFIADHMRIRRVTPDGIIHTVYGCSVAFAQQCAPNADGATATLASIDGGPYGADEVVDLTVTTDGTVYFATSRWYDYVNATAIWGRVRGISAGGILTTVAGRETNAYSRPDLAGGSALGVQLVPTGIAITLDGTLYLSDSGALFRLGTTLPGMADNPLLSGSATAGAAGVAAYRIASPDGARLLVFDGSGRHLWTLNTLTGDTLYRFAYDAAGRFVSVTDHDGLVTRIERDGAGNPVALVSPQGERTAVTLDASGNLAGVTNPQGQGVQMAFGTDAMLEASTDARGNATKYAYDTQGRLVSRTEAAGGSVTYSEAGTVSTPQLSMASGMGRVGSFSLNPLLSGGAQQTARLPSGQQVSATINPDGTRTTLAPDGTRTTLAQKADPRFGMQAPLSVTTTVLPSGLTRVEAQGRGVVLRDVLDAMSLLRQTDSLVVNGRVTTEVYDRTAGTVLRTTAAGRHSVRVLDAAGRVLRDSVPGFDVVVNRYDADGRLVQVTQGDRSRRYTYDDQGRVSSTTDALGRTETYAYDAAGRLLRQTFPDSRVIAYSYDASGNLLSVSPPTRPEHLFTYTVSDQSEAYYAPDVGSGPTVSRNVYNADGQLTATVRPGGTRIEIGYDSAGRRSTVTLPDGTYTYRYDAASGKLSGITAPDGSSMAYTYDGTLTTQIRWSGVPSAATLGLRYDSDFRLVGETIDGLDTVKLAYDADGLLSEAGALQIQRDAENGLITGTSLGGVTTAQSYNSHGERTSLSASFNGDTLYRTNYTRDATGRIVSRTETLSGERHTWGYAYDETGRLVQVTKDGSPYQSYEYDGNGNRLRLTTPSGVLAGRYDAQDRLLGYGDATYGYGAAGELIWKAVGSDTTRYSYDALGNLRSVVQADGTRLEYLLDAQGHRVGKKVGGRLTEALLWESDLRPAAMVDSAGEVTTRFVYGEKPNVPEYMTRDGHTYRLITDHLGSVRLVVDVATGEVAERIDYDPFGEVTTDSNPGFQPFGYAGGLYDSSTGLVRFGARDYDARTARWTAKDPIAFQGADENLYRYSTGDPVNASDPNGEETLWEFVSSRYTYLNTVYNTYSTVIDGTVNAASACLAGAQNANSGDRWSACAKNALQSALGSVVGARLNAWGGVKAGGEIAGACFGSGFVGFLSSQFSPDPSMDAAGNLAKSFYGGAGGNCAGEAAQVGAQGVLNVLKKNFSKQHPFVAAIAGYVGAYLWNLYTTSSGPE